MKSRANLRDDGQYDFIIIGGGFYGCCLALFLRSLSDRILVLEAEDSLLSRASRVNQARIHSGFHYPRSFVTAMRSSRLQARFVKEFKSSVYDEFSMLYAVARWGYKVSEQRFERMFREMAAPIESAGAKECALFNSEQISGVFRCREYAFDWRILRDRLREQLSASGVSVVFNTKAHRIKQSEGSVAVEIEGQATVRAPIVFNVTYANLNSLLLASGLKPLALKHELTELALVGIPPELRGLAVTVMDGPFFSAMPYPSTDAYSLTHVRYTPHYSWIDRSGQASAIEVAKKLPQETRWRQMMLDAARYMPCLRNVEYERSLFEVKTVMLKSEKDDGRPILLRQHADAPGLYSVLGAKIDNIYDLFDSLPQMDARLSRANDSVLCGYA